MKQKINQEDLLTYWLFYVSMVLEINEKPGITDLRHHDFDKASHMF